MSTTKRSPSDPRQGETLPQTGESGVPKLPHERDESAGSQHIETPRPEIQQAQADVDRGLVDTDRSKPMDEVYNRTLRSDKPQKNETKR